MRVLEVDHPATQSRKRAVLDRLGARSPAEYVTWDFESRAMDDLTDVLDEAGLDVKAPVFTIWEGVTMYLTEPAIDASLRAIRVVERARLAARAHLLRQAAHHTPSLMTRAMMAVVATFGEPWKFGWAPEELPGYLEARDFSLIRDVAIPDAAKELLPRQLAALVSNPNRRFALASAPESIAVVS